MAGGSGDDSNHHDHDGASNNRGASNETERESTSNNEDGSGCCGRKSKGGRNNNRRTSSVSFSADFKLNEKPRTCTDVLYLIFYVLFCLLMIVIAVFAINYGNPLRLINGMDSYGNICGYNNKDPDLDNLNMSFTGMDMRNKSFVLFFDLENMKESIKICVEQCPDVDIKDRDDLLEFYKNTSINLCQYDYNFQLAISSNSLIKEVCPKLPYYASHPIMKRCIPKPTAFKSKIVFIAYQYLDGLDIFKQILGDLAVTWPIVLGLSSLSFVFSCVFIGIFHCITGIISYLVLILSVSCAAGFTGFLWWTYSDISVMVDSMPDEQKLQEYVKNEHTFLALSIISTIFTVFLFLISLYLRKRVSIVVQLFREAGSALKSLPWLFLQPFITYCALISFLLGWLLVMLCLATSDFPRSTPHDALTFEVDNNTSLDSNPTENGTVANNRTVTVGDIADFPRIEYSDAIWVKYMWWVYLIGLVWCSEFILACQQMIIASAVSTWYFSRNRSNLTCVVGNAIGRLIKYNLGSVALGSLLITLVKIPRLVLSFSQRILRKWEHWSCVKLLMKGCVVCLACFENCLRYIHHNAYTVIAIQGINFCPASRLAFSALLSNTLQISVINTIGDFVLFLAKCITSILTGIIAILIFQNDDRLYFYAIPVFLTVVFSYFISHAVISVFEMAVDTLFLCFCEDHNMNDTTDSKNYYAHPSLLKYMKEDVVDALAPGRRELEANSTPTKTRIEDPSANAEELIPMTATGGSEDVVG